VSVAGRTVLSICRKEGSFGSQHMPDEQHRGYGSTNADSPNNSHAFCIFRSDRCRPENHPNTKQYHQSCPLERPASIGIYVWFSTARSAPPMFPQPDGQNGNPEDVAYIKRSERDRPPPFPAVKAVVIAKCDSLRPKMVSAVNEKHAPAGYSFRKAGTSTARDYSFSNCRAITNRWISLVPSPIVHNFTSR
jgi:hypothetical protein